jgi:hypothetical protein
VGGTFRRGLRRHAHNLRCVDRRFAPAARQVRLNRSYTTFGESVAPRNDLTPTDFEPPRNLVIANSIGREQHNSRAPHTTGIKRLRSHAAFQFHSLFIGQSNRGG